MGLANGFFSLFRNINKVQDGSAPDTGEGAITPLLPELELDMSDEDLLSMTRKWEQEWMSGSGTLQKDQKDAENYWLGIQYALQVANDRPLIDNRIFSSLETFLPIATSKNPEALCVTFDGTAEGRTLATSVRKMLNFEADRQALKLKVRSAVRNWNIYFIGVMKVGWDVREDNIATFSVRPQRLILDPNGVIDETGHYLGEFIGEHRRDSAQTLIDRFPAQKAHILSKVGAENLGTIIQYQEFWTNDIVFWKLGSEILGKSRNPHWNYDGEETRTDEYGDETKVEVRGSNHFAYPRLPYLFLSVFNLGKHPWDDTSLIKQNLGLQDLVNKRMVQIDKNVDDMNGGYVVSGEKSGLSKEEAQQAINASRRGGGFYVKKGDAREAVVRTHGEPLPSDVFNSLADARQEIDNIFGTHATTRGERIGTETATGRLTLKEGDTGRIGNPADYIEQFVDQVFNWWLQLMYVYYDDAKIAAVLGTEDASETIMLHKSDLNRKLLVSVKEGSMLPQDPLNKRNEAIDLWNAKALDPITLFDRLEFPNPKEMAKNLFLWMSNPAALFPDIAPPASAIPGQPIQPPPEAAPPPGLPAG